MKDNLNKLVGFAETLFTGRNVVHSISETPTSVDRLTQKRCFYIALDRFNNGGYILNRSNHIRG